MNRLSALASIVVLLCALAASPAVATATSTPIMTSPTPVPARVAIFSEPDFPSVDAARPDVAALKAALPDFDVSVLDSQSLVGVLDAGGLDVLVLPFGSAFPQSAWPAIHRYLSAGGNLVNLGGVPFAVPAIRGGGRWRMAARTPSYHKQLGIVQAFPVPASGLEYRRASDGAVPSGAAAAVGADALAPLAADVRATHIFELIVRLTDTKAFPDEDGSDGPREARLDALVHGFRKGGLLPAASPFVQIDRLANRFAGGRWLFATGDGAISPERAALLVRRAAFGAIALRAQPRYAGFHPGEPIALTLALERPRRSIADNDATCELRLLDRSDAVVARTAARLTVEGSRAHADVIFPVDSATLARGLYRVVAVSGNVTATTGLWVYDAEMLRGGRPVTAGRDYFVRDGAPFPVTGTTYMASNVHRRFLLEPNAAVWDADFRSMARVGVNMVRTGIWTGWSLHSEQDGRPTEAVLRALEVFLLTARQHGIPVIFNLFAFTPPTWGGTSPYFDAAALAAQRRFAGGIAARFERASDIIWDLINEPSFSAPNRLWSTRPNYDAAEQSAWEQWSAVPVFKPAESTPTNVHDRWNSVTTEPLSLPALEDFGDKNLFGTTRPNKAADYKRFAQASFRAWVKDISSAIRANGNRAQLITVGQDEGGAGERPNPLLFADAVDFVGTHTWWNNDALLWDALIAKPLDRPSLVGETGLMTYERIDGSAWRDETQARNLLERKLALAFAGGGAGFIEWVWNTNVYMPSDNEAGIGLLRGDGTAKAEFDAFAALTAFINRHRDVFTERALEEVVVFVPQSQGFSVRDFAAAATQRAVRALEYDLHVPVRLVNEYATDGLGTRARLIVVPSPRVLTDAAWNALLGAADAGATVLITGPFDRDEYERPTERLKQLGLEARTAPVAPMNLLHVGSRDVAVPFRGSKLERLERAVVGDGQPASVRTVIRGKGRIVWCPLPVEVSDNEGASVAVYRDALKAASLAALSLEPVPPGILVRPLVFRDHVLFVVVNESDRDAEVTIPPPSGAGPLRPRASRATPVSVEAERALLVLTDKRTGKIIDTSR